MRVLGIETSTILGGVAIMEDASLVVETRLNVRTTHSESLMSAVDYALKSAGMSIGDIDTFSVATGPGSFTGLRIGLSTVKGLSYATGKPVTAVPSLEAFAWNFPFSRHPVCTMLDARKNEVYAAIFEWDGMGFHRIFTEAPVSAERLAADVLKGIGKVVMAGEGALIYRKVIEESLGAGAIFAPPHLMVPAASNVAFLGLRMALAGQYSDPSGLCPFYIRKSEAELKSGQ